MHVAIDNDIAWCEAARNALNEFDLTAHCDVICADSLSISTAHARFGIDVLVLDSNHSEPHVRAEWAQFSPLLTVDGTAIFHDTTKEPGPAALVADLRASGAWDVMSWPEGPGWTMVRRRAQKE
jgi:cephalosporin hydroxylase